MSFDRFYATLLLSLAPTLVGALASGAQDDQEELVVIRAGQAITMTGRVYRPAVILVAGGKVRQVGQSLEIPKSARVIDARRQVVMPGMICARSRWQLASYTRSGIHGDRSAGKEVVWDQIDFSPLVRAGFTAVCFYPAGTGIVGPGTVYRTAGDAASRTLGDAYLRITMSSPGRDKKTLREAIDKAKKEIEKVEKARKEWEEKQKKAKADAAKKPAEKPQEGEKPKEDPKPREDESKDDAEEPEAFTPPKIDPAVLPLVRWLRDKKGAPLLFELSRASDLRHLDDALRAAPALRGSLVYLAQAYASDYQQVVPDLGRRGATVVLQPRIGNLPYTVTRYPLAAALQRAGCQLVMVPTSDATSAFDGFRARLADLVRAGLPRREALASVTIGPATALGLSDRLGTIETGKDADLIFLDGDPLSPHTRVARVMTLGKIVWEATEPRLAAAQPLGAVSTSPVAKPKATPAEQPSQAKEATAETKASKNKKPDRYFAVTGATVHTVTGPTLTGATVLAKNGKIAAIGHDVAIPKDAQVLDAAGYHLYPGLVAVRSSGIVGSEPPEDNTNVFSLYVTLGLAGGITTVASGNTAAKLTFGTLDDHLLKRNLFHTLKYGTGSPGDRRKLRGQLDRVRQYLRDLEAYEEAKKRDPKAKAPDKAWLKGDYETALKLLRHERKAVADAEASQALLDLAGLAETYGIQIVVRGAREGWTVAPEMARARLQAIITPRTRRDRDERRNRPNGSSIENARILHEHGVTLAIVPASTRIATWGIAGRDLMHLPMEAAFAVRGGLPDDAAVRAITIDAARILGVDHRVGSVEVGKDADFAIVDGDLLHYMTMVRWTVVNGRIAYDKQKDSLLNHIRPDGKLDAPPPPDYWPRSLGQPVGPPLGRRAVD